MPNETYQPKKYKRSRRRRATLVRRFWGVLGIIIVYVLITRSLDRLDSTPRWARVSFPSYAVLGTPYGIDVRYRGLPKGSKIKAEMAMTGKDGQSLGELNDMKGFEVDRKWGSVWFFFQMSNDPNASSISMTVSCDNALENSETRPMPAIRSGNIPILSVDHELVQRANNRPAWENVMIDAAEEGSWLEHRGDPTVIGWAITIFYAFAAMACLYCTGFMDSRRSVPISCIYAWFWWMMLGLMVFMGINKQLDLQLLLADIGRAYTKHQGWYGQRKPVQIRVLAIGACVCLACLQEMSYRLKRAPKSTWLALCGIILLGLNVLIHLVSMHSIEYLLAYSCGGLSLGDGLEILSILWILISTWVYNHTQRETVSYIMQ